MADWDPLANEIFMRAIEAGSTEGRAEVLDRSCRDDAELRRKVEALLMAHDVAGSFLDHPAPGLAEARAEGATTFEVDPARTPPDHPEAVAPPAEATLVFVPQSAPADVATRPIAEGPGTRIGPYKLLQQIGEGGMGVVYMAEQEAARVRRKVALKIIKPGMDTGQVVARFEAERQALALMDHPHIAKVLDAGATDTGRPFFVMELVKGVPITEYCDQAQLTPRERLELFVPICRAIQHAHQKGIIHRDVKPSNVMITLVDGRPTPKVIDFGVAKATDQRLTERSLFTQYGAIVGTLEYMSPEQAEMSALDVDTRSDVFSLGVLLYELLTGSTPLERARLREVGYAEILRRIREEEPPRPSTRLSDPGQALALIASRRHTEPARLTRLVRGELDWIVMKSLEKDRTRRYETAAGFARDVERYLSDEAVEACPPSRRYRLGKFARKNRGTLTTAAAFALVLLVAAVGGGYLAVRAIRAEGLARNRLTEAEQSRDQARAVSQFMVEAFRKPNPEEGGRDVKVVDLLDAAEARLGSQFGGSPAIRGALLQALGETYLGLGLPDRAIDILTRARALLEGSLGPEHLDTLECNYFLARGYFNTGRPAEAVGLVEETLRLKKVELGPDPDHVHSVQMRSFLISAYSSAGRPAEAIARGEETLKLSTTKFGPDHEITRGIHHNLADAYDSAGRPGEAIAMLEETLRINRAKLGPDHSASLSSRNNLAMLYLKSGRMGEAITMLEENLKSQTSRLGPDHRIVLLSRLNLSSAYCRAGRAVEAISLDKATLEMAMGKRTPDDYTTLRSRGSLAESYRQAGRLAEAIALYEETFKLWTARFGPDHPETLTFRNHLAAALTDDGRVAEAITILEETLRLRKAKLGPDHPDTLTARNDLAACYARVGRTDEAIAMHEETLRLKSAQSGPDHPETLTVRSNLAEAYRRAGRTGEAIAMAEETLKLSKSKLGPDYLGTLSVRNVLAEAYRQAGRLAEAIALGEETLKLRTAKFVPDHPATLTVRSNLGEAYRQAGRPAEAIPLHEETLKLRTARSGPDHPDTLTVRNNLAAALADDGRLADAIALHEETLKLRTAKFGPDHFDTLTVRNNLAEAYRKIGRVAEAITLYEETLKRFTANLGPDHFGTLTARNNLAAAYQAAGRKDEAIGILREVVPAVAKAFGPGHPNTLRSTNRLAGLLEEAGRWDEAEPLLRESLKISEAKQPDEWATFHSRSLLGAILAGQRKFAEAEPLLIAGYEGMKAREARILPADRPRLAEAGDRLVRFYEAWGKPEKAAEWRKTLRPPPADPPASAIRP